MPRLQITRRSGVTVDAAGSPETAAPAEADRTVPASFSDWLAQPSASISAHPEPEPRTFVGRLDHCSVQLFVSRPAKPFRR
jgi:hypothetical protein